MPRGRTVKAKTEINVESEVKKDFVLENVPDENIFSVIDGSTIGSLSELAEALELMSDDVFHYHTERVGNDFATWIAGTMGEEELANSIISKSKEETHIQILKYIIKKLS